MWLRFSMLLLLVVLVFSCKEINKETNSVSRQENVPEKSGVEAPVFQDLEGNPLALADYKGKRVLLNYWATWCKPCIEEMPSLLRLQEQLLKENYVFLLASDQEMSTIKNFKEKRGFDFNFIKFNGIYADLNINAIPVTVIYNEKGEEIERITGATSWDTPEMIEKLKEIH